MNKRRPMLMGVTGISALAMTLSACGGNALGGGDSASKGAGAKVKVGVLVSLSGAYAPVGQDMKRGFELYLSQHDNMLGGHKVDLDVVDEGSSAQSGSAGDTRLAQKDNVDAVVGIVSGPTAAAGRNIFDAAKVPVLMGNTGSVDLGKNPSKWIWRASYDNGDPGRILGTAMAKDASAGKFYLIGADYSGGHETLDGFKQTFPKDRIAGEVYNPPFGQTSDYSPYMSKIKASGAKNVFVFDPGADAIQFVKQFYAFGLNKTVQLYGAGFITQGQPTLKAQGQAALGVRDVTRYNWDIKNGVNQKFVAAYEAKFKTLPTVYAANMYDIGIILDKAIGSIKGTVDRESIRNAIANLGSVDGARGKLSFSKDNTVEQQFYLTEVKKTANGVRNVMVKPLGRS